MARTQPTRSSDFIAWVMNLVQRCTEHQPDWQIDTALLSQFQELSQRAETAYTINSNREEANHRTAVEKRLAFANLRRFIGPFVGALRANMRISEADLEAMGLPPRTRAHHEPLPPPDEAPMVVVIPKSGHRIFVYAAVPQSDHPTESTGKKGTRGFIIRYRIDGDEEWREVYSSRRRGILQFDEGDEGKRITLAASWLNPRMQHGPWSAEHHARI
ncbi:MAG: hypothetical protein LBS12_05945 [Prevotellaceae bacterium]|nr:hypothetical protein [Prevotellaceae bacterium]